MGALGSMLAVLHVWVATAAAILAGGVLVLALIDVAAAPRARLALRWRERLSLALFVALIGAVLLGPGIVIGVGPAADATHYLYALAAVAAVPAGRLLALRNASPRGGWWVAGGALVTLLALLRLWATGG